MNRRNMLSTLGASALGVGILLGGSAGAFAQDATTPPAVSQAAQPDPRAEFAAERAQAYDEFVAALASELGNDEAAVDAAIRAALTQAIDARLAAGDIDEERAAAAKAVIQVSDAPLMTGFGGPGGHARFQGRGGDRGHGGPGFGSERGDKQWPGRGENGTPNALPAAPGAPETNDQSASVPVTTSEGLTS
ncbi:MAG: hypothetical protein R2853_16595 [Thermomicrobiales bacterium]